MILIWFGSQKYFVEQKIMLIEISLHGNLTVITCTEFRAIKTKQKNPEFYRHYIILFYNPNRYIGVLYKTYYYYFSHEITVEIDFFPIVLSVCI